MIPLGGAIIEEGSPLAAAGHGDTGGGAEHRVLGLEAEFCGWMIMVAE